MSAPKLTQAVRELTLSYFTVVQLEPILQIFRRKRTPFMIPYCVLSLPFYGCIICHYLLAYVNIVAFVGRRLQPPPFLTVLPFGFDWCMPYYTYHLLGPTECFFGRSERHDIGDICIAVDCMPQSNTYIFVVWSKTPKYPCEPLPRPAFDAYWNETLPVWLGPMLHQIIYWYLACGTNLFVGFGSGRFLPLLTFRIIATVLPTVKVLCP